MNGQVIALLAPQAQNFAVRSTPLDVSNKPSGSSRPTNVGQPKAPVVVAGTQVGSRSVSSEKLADMVDKVNLSYDPFEIEARFTMSKNGKRVIVTLHNTRTGEIIRRIPPEDFASRFEESTGKLGLWFNRKV